MLTGKAKTKYQREYMRRRRAALKREPQPHDREIASLRARIARLDAARKAKR